jgi:hypothetical protein
MTLIRLPSSSTPAPLGDHMRAFRKVGKDKDLDGGDRSIGSGIHRETPWLLLARGSGRSGPL